LSREEKNQNLDFIFECEQCTEIWSENLLDFIDRCTHKELVNLIKYIKNKLESL